MTIRRLLLVAFLLVSLVPAVALTVLAFNRTRAAMLGEIEQGVRRSAASVAADLDKLLFERLLNATTWNHLELMQDLRLDDVDKRVSAFLAEMKRQYGGVYLDLLAVDGSGHIVASSTPARIGLVHARPAQPWLSASLPGGSVTLDPPGEGRLAIRSVVASQFTAGTLGELVLEVDWARLQGIVDAASDPTRQLLVADAEGRIVVASALLRSRGAAALSPAPAWLPRRAGEIGVRDGSPWIAEPLLVGTSPSPGFATFDGFAWTTSLLQSRAVALAPVRHMAWTFAGLLAAIALLTALASLGVAGVIARPISALTDFTRRYLQPGAAPEAPPEGPGEIGELSRSFVHLVRELQHAQATLGQASKLAALGEVTALMAHEVRTPLGILRSSAQMLRMEPALSAEGQELTRIVESETQRLNRLVSSMLDSARTRTPALAPTDVHGVIRYAVSLLAAQSRERGIAVRLHCNAADPVVEADSEQIAQVLLNLVTNALQVLPAGGSVDVSTRNEPGRLVVEVADDGPGIPAAERSQIFEPFVFKREGGIGLGLAVVRQILRQHGGDIVADGSSRGGALFRFWLPRQADGA